MKLVGEVKIVGGWEGGRVEGWKGGRTKGTGGLLLWQFPDEKYIGIAGLYAD